MVTAIYENEPILLVRWKDNAVVTVASTCYAADPVGNRFRWSKAKKKDVLVDIPYSVQNYNDNMGGTDRMDQNINAYRVSIRGKKWWWCLFTWMLDVAVQNAWLLARKKNPKLTQLNFRRDLVMAYLLMHKNPPKSAGRKPETAPGLNTLRFDKMDHWVQKTGNNKQRRCAGDNCTSTVQTDCSKCNVGLCINCFQPYHAIC